MAQTEQTVRHCRSRRASYSPHNLVKDPSTRSDSKLRSAARIELG